jgi:long-chain acyl-CoA synthetase
LKFAPTYTWLTYGDVDLKRRYIGSALHSLFQQGGFGGGELQTVGIWVPNCPEWQIVDIACQSYQKVTVSLYDTLGKDSVEFIINHAHITVLFVTSDHIPTLLKLVPKVPNLKMIVCVDIVPLNVAAVLKEWTESQGLVFGEFSELETYGKANLIEPISAYPDLIASICYTSGTTNNPKGVLLTHKNLATSIQSQMYGVGIPENPTLISYLPLAHIYGRLCELGVIALGGQIGYFTGDPLRLLEDAQVLKPNFFPSVPRLLNRIYQSAMAAGNVPGFKGALFKRALQAKLDRFHNTGAVTHAFWDRLVFRKIQAVLGGRILMVSSGSAPISPQVMDFLKIAFSCEVAEGYGMTENCATCTKTWSDDPNASGTVGPPLPINEVKLIDVPAMGYTSEDKPNPRGEICMRGPNCFTAYYKDEKNTKETVDAEGWVHTGDVAEIDSCGRFKIVDRIKNIMKLSQGEYVALEKIENVYSNSPLVAQLYVHGEGLQSYLVGVLVPDPIEFATIVSDLNGKKIGPEDAGVLAAACQEERVITHILALLTKVAEHHGLHGFEMVKNIHLSLEPFSIADNTLTPTLKVRRKDVYKKYKREIDGLYALSKL